MKLNKYKENICYENICWTGYEMTYHNARKLPEVEDKKPLR